MIEYEVYQCLGLNRVKMYYTLKVLQNEVNRFIFNINHFANFGVCFPLQLHSYIFRYIVESLVVDNQRNYFTWSAG